MDRCPFYSPKYPSWQDISAGHHFYQVATNPATERIWAVTAERQYPGIGRKISEWKGTWSLDDT